MNHRNTAPAFLLAAIAGLAVATDSSEAAEISKSTTAPTVDALDVSNYATPTATQKWFSDVEHDAGQTFTPTGDGLLQSFTVWLASGNPNDAGDENVNLRFGTISRPGGTFTFTDVYTENAAMAPSPGGDWAAGDYVTFTFDTPQPVTAGVEYGIITDAQKMGTWQLGIPYRHRTPNVYAGGVMINRGGESANTDLVFHVDIVPDTPDTFPLVITPNDPTSLYKLEWPSQAGMVYRVLSNTGLGTPVDGWPVVEADIAATPPTNIYNVDPPDPRLFYAVEEYPAPPVTLWEENFDGTTPGSLPADWTTGKNPADNSSLTNWELGTPANVGPIPPGVPLPSGANCVATNISGNYDDPAADLGVAHTDIWLRSPAIDLGAAASGTLTFQHWTQIEDVAGDLDYGSIRILDASDDSELAVMENQTIDGNTSGWEEYSMALPAAAFTAAAGTIKVEFQFEADDIDSFAGWYIDDVAVTTP